MTSEALILPHGLRDYAAARPILKGRWGQVYEKTATTDLRDLSFILTVPCLSFLVSGQERLSVEKQLDLVVKAKDMVLIPPGLAFSTNFRHRNGPLRAYLFFFNKNLVREFDDAVCAPQGRGSSKMLFLKGSEKMTLFMETMDHIYSDINPNDDLVKAKLLELLHIIGVQAGVNQVRCALQQVSGPRGAPSIRDIMLSEFLPELTVKDYASIAELPIASFNREFKRAFGVPPGKWLYGEKMKRAAKMLINDEVTVTQVGHQLGYQSTSHFIERFDRFFGETPKQYQKSFVSNSRQVLLK